MIVLWNSCKVVVKTRPKHFFFERVLITFSLFSGFSTNLHDKEGEIDHTRNFLSIAFTCYSRIIHLPNILIQIWVKVLCFLIDVTLVVEVHLLNFEIVKRQNHYKYKVLDQCWLRCLPRGWVVARGLAWRISEHISRKDNNYTGLNMLFFSNQPQAGPDS